MRLQSKYILLRCVLIAVGALTATCIFIRIEAFGSRGSTSSYQQIARTRAINGFEAAYTVLMHPRCVNCHPAGNSPLRGEDSQPHAGLRLRRGLVTIRALKRKDALSILAHATMEPMNCTAHVTDDSCTVWGPLQGPELAKLALSGMFKLPPEKVSINRTLLGGGFGLAAWLTPKHFARTSAT
jgi:Molybdopterin-binding domain of aldehyde dehydrogenase